MFDLMLAAMLMQPADPCHSAAPPGPPRCPAWRPFSAVFAGREMLVDPASVRRDGTAFEIAMRTTHTTDQPGGVRSGITVNRFDCARQTVVPRQMTAYDARGAIMARVDTAGLRAVPEPLGHSGPWVELAAEFCPADTAAAPDPCYAADVPANRPGCPAWREVRRDATAARFVQPDSVNRNGGMFEISTRITFASPQTGGMVTALVLADYDCARRTGTPAGLIAFDASGTRLPRVTAPIRASLIQDSGFDARILADYCQS
jgi:hypothetical protein